MDEYTKQIEECAPKKARKSIINKNNWKSTKAKQERYKPKGPPGVPKCGHASKTFGCNTLSYLDRFNFHSNFYATSSKTDQDNFIIKFTKVQAPKRRRPKTNLRVCKQMSYIFFVRKGNNGTLVRVCKPAFLNILGINKDRVYGVLKRHFETGQMAKENRGGDKKSMKNKHRRDAIKFFLESLKCQESHYCRSKSACRVYLPPELNITKLYKMYQNSTLDNAKVKQSFFRREFCTKYNIGFGSPRTDVCSTCIQINEKIKLFANDNSKKVKLMAERTVHKMKAKAFFASLQEEKPEMITMSFDCQKNLPIPKLPDQQAYFSKQYNFYNFAIVVGSSKATLGAGNVFCYCWNETVRPKSSNEIASAVFHRLSNTNLDGKSVIRLYADGCGGQNKNTTMIGMCCKWLKSYAAYNIKKIEIIFPVVGHSFIPPDRVFGNIEKGLRKKEVIISPQEYLNYIQQYSTVLKIGEEVPVLDWKSEVQKVQKPPGAWHFKFNPSKRFIITIDEKRTIKIQGEVNYRCDIGAAKCVLKKNQTLDCMNPRPLPVNVPAKQDKVQAVAKLLEAHFGENWRHNEGFEFYKDIEIRCDNEEIPIIDEHEEMVCEALEELESLSV